MILGEGNVEGQMLVLGVGIYEKSALLHSFGQGPPKEQCARAIIGEGTRSLVKGTRSLRPSTK